MQFVRDFDFFLRYPWVGVRSLCVEYAWLCAGHVSAVSAYPSELVRNRARPHPSTDVPPSYHAWTAHVSRLSRNGSLYLEGSRSVRVRTRSVSDSCVGRASNVRGILHRICSYASTCAIFQWIVSDCKNTCAVNAWFMRDSSMICTSDTPNSWSSSRHTSTHKHAQTQICAWFVSDSCVIGCVTGPLHRNIW